MSTRLADLRIAMVTPRFLPHMGGIETHVDEVSRRMLGRGLDVSVLTTETEPSLVGDETRHGVPVRRYRSYPRNRDYYVSLPLTRALTRSSFDLVHIQGVHTFVAPLALAQARRQRMPTILTFHTGGHSSRLRNLGRRLQWGTLAPLLRQVDSLVAVCDYELDYFAEALRLPRSRFAVIRNGSEPLPVAPAPSCTLSGDPLVLSVGRLERYKGHHRVIQSIPHLVRRAPGVHVAIVGSGPFEAELRALVRALRVDERVSFVSFGPAQRPELGALVARSDVVTLLSEYEAHPVAVMEAVALGTPVVVADTSGLSELSRIDLVHPVPLDAPPREVAAALLQARGVARAPDRSALPSWDDCVDQLLDTYERTLSCAS